MPNPQVALRLALEGQESIESGFAKIADSGSASAKRIANDFQRASEDLDKALDRRNAAAVKVAAVSGGYSVGPDQNAQVVAFQRAMAEQERQAAALRAAIDPLTVAQKRYDDEIAISNRLLASGKISETEHAAAVGLSERVLKQARDRLEEHSASLGLNRTQTIIAQSAVMRFTDSLLAGQSPIRAFALESHKLGEVLALDDGGVTGGLAKVRALINPLTVSLAGATAAAALGAAAWFDYANSIDKLEALAQGVGRASGQSAEQIRASAEAGAAAAHISVSAAQEIGEAYISTGKIGEEVSAKLIGATGDFAAAMGVDAKTAAQQLGVAFADPAKGAEELNAKLGILDQAGVEYVRTLVEENRLTEAQETLFRSLVPAIDGAANHLNVLSQGWKNVKYWADLAGASLGKALDQAAGNSNLDDRLADVNRKLAAAKAGQPTEYKGNAAIYENTADLQRQKADLEYQQRQAAAAAQQGRDLVTRQRAQTLVDQYTGKDKVDALAPSIQTLKAALAAGVPADQRQGIADQIDALTHATSTFIPVQQKKQALDEIDARIAAARTPAQKAALAIEKERISQQGEIITRSQAEADAHAKGAAALATASKAGESHAATLAREAASMDVAARGALALADAYLQGGAAALIAEARAKAATDATKKGIDVEAQARRQLALDVANTVVAGAKSTEQLRAETAARSAVNDNVSGGVLAIGQMNRALSDEAALRPLITAQLVAQQLGMTEYYKSITDKIVAYRKALSEAHDEEARAAFNQSQDATGRRIQDVRLSGQYAGDRTGALGRAQALEAGKREADDRGYNPAQRATTYATNVIAANEDYSSGQKTYSEDVLNSQKDAQKLSQAELATLGMNADQREAILDRVKAEIDLDQRGIDLNSGKAKQILAGVSAQDQLNAKLRASNAAWSEVNQAGDQFIDNVLNPDHWKNFGDLGKSVLKELEQEMIKLAILNPIKNALFGESNQTLSSVSSIIGGLIGHHASGTDYFSGGWTYLNENGQEAVDLPQGSRIYPAAQTRQMLAASNDRGGGAATIIVNANGAVLADTVRDWVRQGVAQAATQGAVGGSRLAQQDFAEQRYAAIP